MENDILVRINSGNTRAERIANCGRAENGYYEIITVFPAPCGKCIAQCIFVVGYAARTGDIDEPAQTESGIDADTDKVFACAFDVQAQDIAAETDHIAQVIEEIGNTCTDGLRGNFAVAACDRGKNVAVGLIVKPTDGAVIAFIRVGRTGFCK